MILTKDGKKRLLRADEIECRQGQWNKEKTRYSVLLYKTARTDMDILDEIFGSENWKTTHYEVKGKDFCMIEVRVKFSHKTGETSYGKEVEDFNYEWVGKSDCGSESNIEAQKGESSDAFKRAGFQWGIGRELYSAPQIWLDKSVNAWDLKVEQIEYDENDKICTLVLSSKGQTVYQFRNGKGIVAKTKQEEQKAPEQPKQGTSPDHDTLEKIRGIVEVLEANGKSLPDILKFYNAKTIGEIPLDKWEKMLSRLKGEI